MNSPMSMTDAAPAADYKLRSNSVMIKRFGLVTSLSDQTLDNTTAITSIALSASIIEKHFTLDSCGGGTDKSFSLEQAEFAALCKGTKTAWEALGKVNYSRKGSELGNVMSRCSPYFVQDLKAGDQITRASKKVFDLDTERPRSIFVP